jgi:hypothetical protein
MKVLVNRPGGNRIGKCFILCAAPVHRPVLRNLELTNAADDKESEGALNMSNVWETCLLSSIGLTRSECAAWVQAWGSILAIVATGAATWIALRGQIKLQRRQQQESDRRALTAAFMIASNAAEVVKKIGRFRNDPSRTESQADRDAFRRDLEVVIESCRQSYLAQLPTESAIKSMIRIKDHLQHAHALTEAAVQFQNMPVQCGPHYAEPLLPVFGELDDLRWLVKWERDRIDDPTTPHPAGWDVPYWGDDGTEPKTLPR